MTKFNQKSFSSPANSKKYRDNWSRVFDKKKECEICDGTGIVCTLDCNTDGDYMQMPCGACDGKGCL